MKIIDFIETMESSISEMKENLANGKLTEDTIVEVYLQHDDTYIVHNGDRILVSQLEDLEEFIKDYALCISAEAEPWEANLENIDLDNDKWEVYSLDSDMLNDAKNGKVIAIIC